ncbi:hypothetical protein JOM56_012738 [Amanita muscaria]
MSGREMSGTCGISGTAEMLGIQETGIKVLRILPVRGLLLHYRPLVLLLMRVYHHRVQLDNPRPDSELVQVRYGFNTSGYDTRSRCCRWYYGGVPVPLSSRISDPYSPADRDRGETRPYDTGQQYSPAPPRGGYTNARIRPRRGGRYCGPPYIRDPRDVRDVRDPRDVRDARDMRGGDRYIPPLLYPHPSNSAGPPSPTVATPTTSIAPTAPEGGGGAPSKSAPTTPSGGAASSTNAPAMTTSSPGVPSSPQIQNQGPTATAPSSSSPEMAAKES